MLITSVATAYHVVKRFVVSIVVLCGARLSRQVALHRATIRRYIHSFEYSLHTTDESMRVLCRLALPRLCRYPTAPLTMMNRRSPLKCDSRAGCAVLSSLNNGDATRLRKRRRLSLSNYLLCFGHDQFDVRH